MTTIEEGRGRLRLAIAKAIGPMALLVLEDLIAQYPLGGHIDGWFLPAHKKIMRARGKLKSVTYYAVMSKLESAGYIYKEHKHNGLPGVWYKINFEGLLKLDTMLKGGKPDGVETESASEGD
jgi:hypothetical protein